MLSWKMWFAFLDRLSGALFVPSLIFLIVLLFAPSVFRRGPALRFFLSAAFAALLFRFCIFFAGIAFEERYMLMLTVLSAPLAAGGIVVASRFISEKLSCRYAYLTYRNVFIVLVLLTGLISAGKGLNPSLDKGWIKDSAKFIKENAATQRIIVISDSADERVSYYAGAEFLKFAMEGDRQLRNGEKIDIVHSGTLLYRGINAEAGKLCMLEGFAEGVPAFEGNVKKLEKEGASVFFVSELPDSELKKIFADAGVPCPLIPLKSFKERKKLKTVYRLRD